MKDELILRPAAMHDAELLHAWRNDPEVRQASHDQSEIDFESHQIWLKQSLENPDRRIFIAERDGVPVGTVRSDCSAGTFGLSWTIAPEFREQGLGKRMVALLVAQIQGPIRAEVRIGNVASVRIAEHVGMKLDSVEGGIMHFRKGI